MQDTPPLSKRDERQRQRGCAMKTRYQTRRKALRKKGSGASYRNRKGLQPYLCKFCGWWHLGHNRFLKKQ